MRSHSNTLISPSRSSPTFASSNIKNLHLPPARLVTSNINRRKNRTVSFAKEPRNYGVPVRTSGKGRGIVQLGPGWTVKGLAVIQINEKGLRARIRPSAGDPYDSSLPEVTNLSWARSKVAGRRTSTPMIITLVHLVQPLLSGSPRLLRAPRLSFSLHPLLHPLPLLPPLGSLAKPFLYSPFLSLSSSDP